MYLHGIFTCYFPLQDETADISVLIDDIIIRNWCAKIENWHIYLAHLAHHVPQHLVFMKN